jgi:hypothetical protein
MDINILLDRLPQITQSGYKIRTDFRESIKFELLMQDNKIDEKNKVMQALNLYYYNVKGITDIPKAIDEMLWFFACGKKKNVDNKTEKDNKKEIKQIYSYEFDAEYIYSAFLQQYKIDLNNIQYMHWWKFKALMENLNEDTQFVKIMGYRAIDISKIKDKEEKARYKRLKSIYALPDMRTTEQKEADFGKAFW